MRRATLAIAVVMVVAGCLGGTPAETPTSEPTATTDPTPTAEPTPTVSDANPYRKALLRVHVNASLLDRDVTPVVNASLRYWERHSADDAGYPIEYVRTDDPDAADVHIEFGFVDECETIDTTDHYGCADIPKERAPTPVTATVDPTLSTPMLERTLTHELGHTLGLEHSADLSVMSARTSPFDLNRTPVYIGAPDGESVTDKEREEVKQALAWYADHSDLENDEQPSWTYAETPANATVVITIADDAERCGFERGGVCGGMAPYSDQYALRVEQVDQGMTAYYVGASLWPAFFEYEERPEELSAEADSYERTTWPA